MHSYPYHHPESVFDNLVSTPVADHYGNVYCKPALSTRFDMPYWIGLTSVSVFLDTLSGSGYTSFMAKMGFGLGMAKGFFVIGTILRFAGWLWRRFS